MNFYPVRFPNFLKHIFSKMIIKKETDSHTVFLTFDDGPTPEVTKWVLDILEAEKVPATFFCVGKNIERNPDLFKKIIDKGHAIGNHTYRHVKGWDTSTNLYINEILKTERLINKYTTSKKLFRPPYGRILPAQATQVQKIGMQLVMWSVVSGDFSKDLNIEKTLWYLSSHTKTGEVIVFHDSVKAFRNLKELLQPLIQNLKRRGFEFGKL